VCKKCSRCYPLVGGLGGGPGVGRMRAAFHLLWVGLVRLLKVLECEAGTLPPSRRMSLRHPAHAESDLHLT
jgi:hypothetical protein